MNWKPLLSLLIIFTIVGLLMFSPKAKNFKDKLSVPLGSFLKGITGKVTKRPVVSKKLDVVIEADPDCMRGQEFSIKGSRVEAELTYDLVSLMDGSMSFQENTVEVKLESMLGSVDVYKNGKMKITGKTDVIELNKMKFDKTDSQFLIVGTPVSYLLEDVQKDKIVFPVITGSLRWSGLKGVSPSLDNDNLELIGFKGMIGLEGESVTISGSVDKIRLNGVDIVLG